MYSNINSGTGTAPARMNFDVSLRGHMKGYYLLFLVKETSGILFFGPKILFYLFSGILFFGPKNNIPEVSLTKKSKKHESRKSPIPYYEGISTEALIYTVLPSTNKS